MQKTEEVRLSHRKLRRLGPFDSFLYQAGTYSESPRRVTLKDISKELQSVFICPFFKGQMKITNVALSQYSGLWIETIGLVRRAYFNGGYNITKLNSNEGEAYQKLHQCVKDLSEGKVILYREHVFPIKPGPHIPAISDWRHYELGSCCMRCGSPRMIPAEMGGNLHAICIQCNPMASWPMMGATIPNINLLERQLKQRKMI